MTVSVIGNPVAIDLKPYTFDALQDAIDNAKPDPRTGAAFVNIDTRVLAALIALERREAPAMLAVLREIKGLATWHSAKAKGEIYARASAILARIDGEA